MSWSDGSCWSLWRQHWHFGPIRGEHCKRLTNQRHDICHPSVVVSRPVSGIGSDLDIAPSAYVGASWPAPTGPQAQIFWFQASHYICSGFIFESHISMMISNLLMFLPKESLFVGKIRGSLLILFNFICGYVFPAIFTDADNSFEVFARSYDQVNALCAE